MLMLSLPTLEVAVGPCGERNRLSECVDAPHRGSRAEPVVVVRQARGAHEPDPGLDVPLELLIG